MLAEPFIAFFLLRSVRRILRNSNSTAKWNRPITYLLYGIVILFIAELVFHIDYITKWIWHAILISIISIALLRKEFTATRTLMFALLPFAILSFTSDLFKIISAQQYKLVDDYFDIAIIFSIVWMIAMIVVSNKQQKALKREQEKTHQEEEQKKWMTTRKEELEKIVAERTSELRQQWLPLENLLQGLPTKFKTR